MILIFDLDFGEIVAMSGRRDVSVIIFRLANTRTPNVIGRVSAALTQVAEALSQGAVVVIEEGRIRVRKLPIA